LDHPLQEIDAPFPPGFDVRGGQESSSNEDVDRADVLVVSHGRVRRADNPLPQLVVTICKQIYALALLQRQ
jgi:hypothetical protein